MAKKLNKKVLIVEDDEDFLSILKMKFESEGFSIVTAQDGGEAIEVAEKEKPDLILSDVLLPKINGIEMAKKIRESNKEVQVVFLTNLTDAAYIDEIKKSDFSYLIKSDFKISDVVEKVKDKLGIN